MKKFLGTVALTTVILASGTASAFECRRREASFAKPGGFPERALTMIVPYGPAGGSGQVAAAMADYPTRQIASEDYAVFLNQTAADLRSPPAE